MENWKTFKETKFAKWEISDYGRVKKNGEIYTPYERGGKEGNRYLCLAGNKPLGGYIHRIAATTFIPNPENKRTVNHIDGDKTNNHISNLEWATYQENARHAFDTGLLFKYTDEERELSILKYRKKIKEQRRKERIETLEHRNKMADAAKQLFGCTIHDSKYMYDHLLEVAIWLAQHNVKLTYKIAHHIFQFPTQTIKYDMRRVNRYMKDLKQST